MADELKLEMRKLENLIGCKIVDVTSRSSTDELIEALNSKYKSDLKNSVRLHRLEFYHALIEDARNKKKKSAAFEEKFLLAKDSKEEVKKEDEEEPEEKEDKMKKHDVVVTVPPRDIDEWKNLLTLSKIYYVLEHPMSEGLTWERNIRKKKQISKFNDKDLIEWRVAQNFRLKALEEWALSRGEARKLADESPYDFDDLLVDDESRELEDMFNILGTQKQKKHDFSILEKVLHTKRPFKFKDEGMEDWTESYSDDSEESDAETGFFEIMEVEDKPQLKVSKPKEKESSSEPSMNDEETSLDIFSSYKEIPKYRRPIFEEMEETKNMEEWWTLCHKAIGEGEEIKSAPPPTIRVTSGVEEREPLEDKNVQSSATEDKMWSKEGLEKEPLMTIDEEDEEYEDIIRRRSTKSHVQLIMETAKAGAKREVEAKELSKEQPSLQISKEKGVDLDDVLRKESSSKSRIGKKNEEDDFGEIPSKPSISKDREITVKEEISSLISAAESSASDLVKAKTSKPPLEKESPEKKESDLDSVLRKESTSKSKVGKKEETKENKDTRKSSISKDAVENEKKLLIPAAKSSALNVVKEAEQPSNEQDSSGKQDADSESKTESSSKGKIDGAEVEGNVKDSRSKSSINEDHESTVNSEAKTPASNVVKDEKPSKEQNSSGKNDFDLDSVMEKKSSSKNKTDETEVDSKSNNATSKDSINEDLESAVGNEIKFIISEAKSPALNVIEESEKSSKESDLSEGKDSN